MLKLFKCPVCGKHIHTLWKRTNCVECHNVNIYGTGEAFKTGADYERHGDSVYSCPHCNYQDDTIDVFIHDVECECEHGVLTCDVYNGFDIEICEHCGMLISSEPVELRRMEPE